MNTSESGLYDFHFIMDDKMKDDLMDLDMFQRIGSFSGLIVEILEKLSPRLEKAHLTGKERTSSYEPVNINPGIKRDDVHVYIPKGIYRKLKLMHQDLNLYSIAQMVRWILRMYLDMVVLYKNDMEKKLESKKKQWIKENEEKRLKPEYIRQLILFIQQNPGEYKLLNIYNNLFSPAMIFLL